MKSRSDAIQEILSRHGRDSVYVASTGYLSRAVFGEAFPDYNVFYMQGSMGLAPAIGIGLALCTAKDVVVINGDGALLMSMGTTHTIREHALPNLFHYVLDNGCHESVGGQPCARLETSYPGVTQVLKISCDGRARRVQIEPAENTRLVSQRLYSEGARDTA